MTSAKILEERRSLRLVLGVHRVAEGIADLLAVLPDLVRGLVRHAISGVDEDVCGLDLRARAFVDGVELRIVELERESVRTRRRVAEGWVVVGLLTGRKCMGTMRTFGCKGWRIKTSRILICP